MPVHPQDITDPALLRLPHPARSVSALGLTGFDEFYRVLPPATSKFLFELFSSEKSLPQIQGYLLNDPRGRPLAQLMGYANSMPSATGTGGSAPVFAAMRQTHAPAPYFLVEDELLDLLEHTDISDDIPVGQLHMPFPRVFIEFGKRRQGLPGVPNMVSGMHVLESAYLELADDPHMGRHLSALFIGSPVGHLNIGDDATLNMALPMGDPNVSLLDAHALSFELMAQASRNAGYNEPDPAWRDSTQALMQLLLKTLLYIGLPGIRREVHNDRSELSEQLARLKSSGKRAKLERKLAKAADYIVIKAPPVAAEKTGDGDGSRSVKTHWRRGHLRSQRHGPKLTLTKTVFIAPALVGMGEAPAPAAYVVR